MRGILRGAFLCAGLVTCAARGNLITNGDFELPSSDSSSPYYTDYTTGSTGITGWTVVGSSSANVSTIGSSYTAPPYFSFPAESGKQWVDLTGDNSNTSGEGVQQTVATLPATKYSLSFYVGNVVDNYYGNPAVNPYYQFTPNGVFGQSSTVDLALNGVTVLPATNGSGGSTQTWQQFNVTFTTDPTSVSTTFGFLNGDPSQGHRIFTR